MTDDNTQITNPAISQNNENSNNDSVLNSPNINQNSNITENGSASENPGGIVNPSYTGFGNLIVQVSAASGAYPIVGALVTISDNDSGIIRVLETDRSGKTPEISLPTPSISESMTPGKTAYSVYNIDTDAEGYYGAKMCIRDSPSMTILENMSLADNKGKPFGLGFAVKKKRAEVYREKLRELGLGLEDKLDVKVGSLSGCQRQAIALLMAVMTPIDFLILDEHTAALDPRTAEIIMQLTDKLVKEKKLTAMMVTHNLRYAVKYGSRLVMMDKRCV